MVRKVSLVLGTMALMAGMVHAEPANRWWAGFGQGTFEYGYNDSSSGSGIYIWCSEVETNMLVTINNAGPRLTSKVRFIVDGDKENAVDMYVDGSGKIATNFHVNADNFTFLWKALRAGKKSVSYSFSDKEGRERFKEFPLKGSANALPTEACVPTFYK